MNHSELLRIANSFRAAIEATPPEARPLSLKLFPRGACGDSSILLGAWLKELGIGGFMYFCGERGNMAENSWVTHAWLMRGELVVDITADQFSDSPAAVVVAEPSLWHRSFTITKPMPSDFRDWTTNQDEALEAMYAELTHRLRVG